MIKKIIILTLFFLIDINASAEFIYLGRSQEGLIMGDAYTAIADDENTLFYNPAALARNDKIEIYTINPTVELPGLMSVDFSLSDPGISIDDRLKNFPNEPALIAEKLMGLPLYLKVGISPTIKMKGFSFSLFAINKTKFVLENVIHPMLNIDYRYDRGFIVGYGFDVIGKAKKKGNHLALGLSLKSVNRQGLKGSYDLFGTKILEILNDSDSYKKTRKNLGYSKGKGFGFDTGLEFNHYRGASRFSFGSSFLDLGGTRYKRSEGDSKVPIQEMSWNNGFAFEQSWALFSYALAFDYHNAIDTKSELATKMHIGARAKLPFMNFYLGWNGGYTSWGLGFDLFIFRFMAGFYGIESGSNYGQREEKRAVFSINLMPVSLSF